MILRASIALLAGTCIAILLALLGAAATSLFGLPPLQGLIPLLAGSLGALAIGRRLNHLPAPSPPSTGVDWLVIGLYLLFAGRSFLWLIFERGDEIAFLNSNNLGDLSLHITYIQSLAQNFTFWPDNPIFTGAPLHYPFGTDLLNALLLQVGIPLERGLVWVGLVGAFLTGVALWCWGRSFALIGFLCNGGFAGWQFFQTGVIHDYQTTEAWKSIPLALFVTQRGLLYAIPVGLLLLWSWKTRLQEAGSSSRSSQPNAPLPLWLELLFYSTLPLFHLHTFLFLSLMLGSWAAIGAVGWQRQRNPLANRLLTLRSLQLIFLALIPATLLVALVAGYGSASSSIHWKPGWMQGDSGYSPLFFWFFNFGFWPLLVLILLAWLISQRKAQPQALEHHLEARRNLLLTVPALAIFLLGCFVMFAIWEWDNTKLFLWSYLVLLLPVRDLLRRTPVPVQAVAWCCLFLSGFVSLLGGLGIADNRGNGYALARRSELVQIRQSLQTLLLPSDARIAFAPIYNHPLFLLGYHGIAGYEGHLYSHGLDYKATYQHLEQLLKGAPGWEEALHATGVTWLFWGSQEEAAYGSAPQLWRSHAEPVASSRNGTLYYLRSTPIENHTPAPLE